MKLENEPEFAGQSPPRKSYNPFDSDDEDTDGQVKNNGNAYDIKSLEKNAESLASYLDHGDVSWEEAIVGSCAAPAVVNGDKGFLRKDTELAITDSELFSEKIVTECELPELMICYKDNAYHSVKDIGVDEGVPAHDKFWLKLRDDHRSENLSSLPLNCNTKGDPCLENEHQTLPFIEELKSMSVNHLEKGATVLDQAEDLMNGSSLDTENLENRHSANQSKTDDSIMVDEFKQDLSDNDSDSDRQTTGDKTESGVIYGSGDHQIRASEKLNYANMETTVCDTTIHQFSRTDELGHIKVDGKESEASEEHGRGHVSLEYAKEDPSTKPSIMNSIEALMEHSEILMEQPSSQPSELPVLQESFGNDVPNALCYNSKVETGSIALDINSSSIISSKEEEEKKERPQQNATGEEPLESETIQLEKPPKPQTMSRLDDGAPGLDKCVHGESSFSSGMPPPASITYKGGSARCGSMSFRSESSAGSTRSFAFPVLQAEWNSSPVRMAKADQRHFHKHRGWVHSLMCCRF